MTDAQRLPIVLCCAEESEVALVAVVDALHQEGFSPEVLTGVETDTGVLTTATDRVRGAALFVLCQSEDLDRFQVRRLQGLFSARKGPEHRMITVDLHAMGPMAVLPEVRVAAQDLGQGSGSRGDEDDGRYMRDVVVPSSLAVVPGASIPDRPRRRRGTPIAAEPEGISEAALGLGAEVDTRVAEPHEVQPPRELLPDPDVLIATDPTGETVTPFSGMTADAFIGDGVPNEVPDDFPVVGESSQDVEIRGAPNRGAWAASGPIEVDRVRRDKRPDPRAEEDDRPLPGVSSPIALDPMDEPASEATPEPRRGGRIGLLLLAGAGMAGLVAMAVMHADAPTEPVSAGVERGVPTARDRGDPPTAGAETAPAAADGSTGSPGAADESTGQPAAVASTGTAEPTGGTGEDGNGTGDAAATDEGTTGGPAEEAGSTGEAATGGEPEPAADGGAVAPPPAVPPPPTADPSANQLDQVIEAALADGRLQELDGVLVLATGGGTMTWDDASNRCRRRKFEGIKRWRLPSKGQLARLRKAKLLGSGSYWSRTVVGGDEVYAIDAASGRMNVWLKMEPNAKALCVRKRP